MKTLILFRHGDSDWSADADHQRPLTGAGRRAARAMGRFLARSRQVPDLVRSSSALRARTTTELAMEAGGWSPELEIVDALYGASAVELLELARSTPESTESVMLVGHEPGFSAITGRLIGQAVVAVPTAAMARVDLDVERWADLDFGCGRLLWLVPPQLVEDDGSADAG